MKGSVVPIVDFTTCGRCGVGLVSGCISIINVKCAYVLFYFKWSTYSFVRGGWSGGALIVFSAGLFSGFICRRMVWMLVWLC